MADVILKGEWLRCGRGHGVARALHDVVVLGRFPAALFSEWMMAPPASDCPECSCGARLWPCTPKPATTEPPEWNNSGRSVLDMVDEYARRKGLPVGSATDHLSRALDEFVARRKAKREPSMSEIVTQALRRSVRVVAKGVPVDQRTEPLARAMSTPLPHDPPMSARLMPWRGKE